MNTGFEVNGKDGIRRLFSWLFSSQLRDQEPERSDDASQPTSNIRRLVLLSDGGDAFPDSAIGVAHQLKVVGIWIETLGFGNSPGEVDEETLKAIASRRPDGTAAYRFVKANQAEVLIKEFKTLVHYNLKPL